MHNKSIWLCFSNISINTLQSIQTFISSICTVARIAPRFVVAPSRVARRLQALVHIHAAIDARPIVWTCALPAALGYHAAGTAVLARGAGATCER